MTSGTTAEILEMPFLRDDTRSTNIKTKVDLCTHLTDTSTSQSHLPRGGNDQWNHSRWHTCPWRASDHNNNENRCEAHTRPRGRNNSVLRLPWPRICSTPASKC